MSRDACGEPAGQLRRRPRWLESEPTSKLDKTAASSPRRPNRVSHHRDQETLINFRSVVKLIESQVLRPRLPFGVSKYIGILRNRRSFSSRRKGSNPISPLPMFSWRSLRDPSGCLLSFKWKAWIESIPIV